MKYNVTIKTGTMVVLANAEQPDPIDALFHVMREHLQDTNTKDFHAIVITHDNEFPEAHKAVANP